VKVLITGAAGFFGRYFTHALRARGDTVTCTDRVWGQDVRNITDWAPAEEFDLVVHLAGNVGGRVAIDQSPLWIGENLAIDAAFFQWVATAQPGRVVYFSSAASYPIALQTRGYENRLSEDMICHAAIQEPDSLYGWAKVTGERLANLARQAGVPVTTVRPFSGYGPEQTFDYPFSCFIARALGRDDPFTIWGDGTQCRDWIHAEDVIGAVLAAVARGIDGPVNLCTGRATSFLELAAIVKAAAGYAAPNQLLTDAPTGPHYRVGDPGFLSTFYTPKVTVEEGVERALAGEQVPAAA
jgi:nucleoside-diphosphate-sugar epimerase